MPDALEFPRVLRAIVPLMRGEWFTIGRLGIVSDLIALALCHPLGRFCFLPGRRTGLKPVFTAVIGTLNDLTKPPACLRRVDAVRINGRSFEMVHFPPAEMR